MNWSDRMAWGDCPALPVFLSGRPVGSKCARLGGKVVGGVALSRGIVNGLGMSPIHDEAARRFSVPGEEGEAILTYELRERNGGAGREAIVTHTYVPPARRGAGIAEQLMHALLAWAEREGISVGSVCSYATAFLMRHREFAHLTAGSEENESR